MTGAKIQAIALQILLLSLPVFPAYVCAGQEQTGSAGAPDTGMGPENGNQAEGRDSLQVPAETRLEKQKALAEKEEKLSRLDAQAEADSVRLAQGRNRLREAYEEEEALTGQRYWQEVEQIPDQQSALSQKWLAEVNARYAETLEASKREYEEALAELAKEEEELVGARAAQRTQIEKDYQSALAQADLRLRRAREMSRYGALPLDESPRYQVREIQIIGNTLLSDKELLEDMPLSYRQKRPGGESELYDFWVLHNILADAGQPQQVSSRTMEGLTRYVLARYRSRGFAGVYVYIGAEAVAGGAQLADDILRVHVVETRVAAIDIDRQSLESTDPNEDDPRVGMSNYRFWLPGFGPVRRQHAGLKEDLLKSWSPVQAGQVIPNKKLERFVAVLNTNPDRYVSAVVSASDEPNAVDLTYEIREGDPWHFYAQVDNAGTKDRQWSPRVGLVNTNVTGRDDRLALMYQLDVEAPDENYAGFANYEFPLLTPRLRLGFYGGYSRFDIGTEATGGIMSFLGDGSFAGVTLRYSVMKYRDWLFDLTGSLSSERSRVQPSLGVDTDVDLQLFGVGFQIRRTADLSHTVFSFERLQNYDGSDVDAFEAARIGTGPDFVKYSASALRRQFIDPNKLHEIRVRLTGITSDERLTPAKMTTFGGLYTVRGYKEDEIVADGGVLASLEYRYDLTKALRGERDAGSGPEGRRSSLVDVSLLGFTDYGRPEIKDPERGEFDTQDMWGVGLGTVFQVGDDFQAGIYHGWALRKTERGDGSIITDSGHSQWNFNFIYRW